jgi:Lon protease-like protein
LAWVDSIDTIHPALLRIICRGGVRFSLSNTRKEGLGLWFADATCLPEDPNVDIPTNLQPCADKLGALIAQSQRQGVIEQLPLKAPYRLDEAGWVANQWAMLLPLTTDDKVTIMSINDPVERLTQVSAWLDP